MDMNLLQLSYEGIYLYVGYDDLMDEHVKVQATLDVGDLVINLNRDRCIGEWKAILVMTSYGIGWISAELAGNKIATVVSRSERQV